MADMVPCPVCARVNSAHRVTCLYCGVQMPSPVARPTGAQSVQLPTNLDALVREALSGGNIDKLQSAMSAARDVSEGVPSDPQVPMAPVSPAPSRSSGPPRSVRSASLGARPLPLPKPPPRRDVPVSDDHLSVALQSVVAAARAAQGCHARGRPVQEALESVRKALDYAAAIAPPPELPLDAAVVPPPVAVDQPLLVPLPDDPPIPVPVAPARERPVVELPRYRHHWMLVIRGPGDSELTLPLAQALDVDMATARLAAIARSPRVALRSDDPTPLRTAAVQVQRLGLDAVVVGRDTLLGIASPDVVLGVASDTRFRVSATWPWSGDAPRESLPDERTLPWSGMTLAVPGEIAVKRYRVGRSLARGRRKEQVLRLGAEQRLTIIDLHGSGRFLRLVAGLTNTVGLPAHDPRSGIRTFKGLVEALPSMIRGCRVEPSRLCSPGQAPKLPSGYDGSQPIEVSGWPSWEEHTRMCRLLAGLSGRDVPVERA